MSLVPALFVQVPAAGSTAQAYCLTSGVHKDVTDYNPSLAGASVIYILCLLLFLLLLRHKGWIPLLQSNLNRP